jgi:preprotein translocase subunit YajC
MNHLAILGQQLATLAAAAPAEEQQPPSILTMLFPLILMFGIIYLLVILPQRKRQRRRVEMIQAVRKNDRIITVGGIHGVITHVRDREVVVKVDDNTKLTINKTGIAHVKGDENEEES